MQDLEKLYEKSRKEINDRVDRGIKELRKNSTLKTVAITITSGVTVNAIWIAIVNWDKVYDFILSLISQK